MVTEQILLKIQRILVSVSIFVPLVVLPSSFIFPFIVPKIILFRTIVLLMAGVYLALLGLNWEKYRPQMNSISIAVLVFWLSFVVSTFAGVDWYRSFWDSHERMLGLFTVTHYVLFYLIVTATVTQKHDWDMLIRVFLGAGGLVMLIGLLQKIQPDLLLNNGSSRVSATLGNAIYMSGYGLFLLFLGGISYVRTAVESQGWRLYAGSTGFLGFLGIFLGGTRGTLLGLLAGVASMLVLGAVVSKRRSVRLGAVGMLVAGIALASLLFVFRESPFVASIPAVGRVVTTDFANIRENTRVMAWEVAWDGFVDKPLFGWGPNNYFYTFNTFYRPAFLQYGYGETWFDNAHNIVMNTLATQGVFGIMAYVSIFFFVAYSLVRARRQESVGDTEGIVLGGFFVGHFIHNIFVFENPTSYLYFFFALAYVCVRAYPRVGSGDTRKKKYLTTGMGSGIAVGVVLLIYVFNINPARANMRTLDTIQSLYQREQSVSVYKEAFAVPTPHIDDVRSDLARTVGQIVPQMVRQGKRDDALQLIDRALADLERNVTAHPMDIRSQLGMVTLYQQRWSLTQQQEDLHVAESVAEHALLLSPKRQQIVYLLASLEQQLGKHDEAIAHVLAGRDADPRLAEGWLRVVSAYESAGLHQQAVEVIEQAYEKQIVFSADEQLRLKQIQNAQE